MVLLKKNICYTNGDMKPKPLVKNAGHPKGFFGKVMIRVMNKEHSSLSLWGLSHLPKKEYRSALDIGCGGGINLLRLSEFCDKVYGIDVSDLSVAESKKRCKKLLKAGRAEIATGKADALPYAEDSMDLVTAFETVYFWGDLTKCFSGVYRTLRKGGVFLIVNELKKDKNNPDKYENIREVLDLTVYDGEELVDALSGAGFKDASVFTEGDDWICAVAIK